MRVHLTSRLHDPGQSEHLRNFLRHVDIAISVHGFGRDGFSFWIHPERGLLVDPYGPQLQGRQTGPLRGIILGGRNARLFENRLPGYHVADERVRLGFHPDNPVNLPTARGVQVELPPGLAASVTSDSTRCPARTAMSPKRSLHWSNSPGGPRH